MRFAPILLCMLLSLAACQKDETVAGLTTPETVWRLVNINEEAITADFTIQFDKDGAVFGQAACNRYTTTQSAPLPWIEFGMIASTKALCPNAELESRFFAALGMAESVEIAGDTLLISAPNTVLTFTSATE